MRTILRASSLILVAASLAACGARGPGGASGHAAKVLNLYIWSDYLAPDTLSNFEKRTGIKVNVSYYDTNETLETKLLAGDSGYDVVVPTSSYFARQIKAGVYMRLDKSKLPNLKNMDPRLMARVREFDPGNEHGVIYMWGTDGVGYNPKMVEALMPDAPLDSWRLIFDPAVASKLAKCGLSVLDSPADVVRAVLSYLGRDPNSQRQADLDAAAAVLMKVRPYIRNINSSEYIQALANGDLCVALGYNGDVMQARDRAREAHNGIDVEYMVPKEGSVLWFDMLAIPKDAPHPASAYAFIDYMMEPKVIAEVSNYKRYANANAAAQAYVDAGVKANAGIYPTAAQVRDLAVELADTAEHTREMTRMWERFKTGR